MKNHRYDGLDPQARTFLETLARSGAPPIHTLPPEEARRALVQLQSGPTSAPDVDVQVHTVVGGPDGEFSIHLYRPLEVSGPLPVIAYFHGGGWVLGNEVTHNRLLRTLASEVDAAVAYVGYTRSPEGRYPVAAEQAHAALAYLARHADKLELDPTRLAVAGDSAGGNLATVAVMLALKRGGPHVRQQVLFYPVTDCSLDTDSYRQFAEGYHLTRDAMRWFWEQYEPDPALRALPTVSPLRAAAHDLRHMPPTLVITAEFDVLRDEGEAYAHRLIDAGVPVIATRQLGTIHDFLMLNALADSSAARGAMTLATSVLRRALGAPRRAPEVELIREYHRDDGQHPFI